jgi:hypothetical protein
LFLLAWGAWAVATVVGGLLYGLVFDVGFSLASVVSLSTTAASTAVSPQRVALYIGLALLLNPFLAAALGGIPTGLLIGHLAAPERRILRIVLWTVASGVGGLLIIGYLLADITGPTTWEEVRYFYAPVTAIVAFLTASAQTLALLRLVSRFSLIFYIPITTIAWVIGWNVGLLNLSGGGMTVLLLFAFSFLCIGIGSGLVLAPRLSARQNALPQ